MSLIGALNVGKSALAVTQAAIQTTSNNIANAGNANYSRQVPRISPGKDREIRPGVYLGGGVNLDAVERAIDEALEGRIRASISEDQAATVTQQWVSRVESLFNELTDQDLSTQLSIFFNSWSNLANKPQDIGLRQVVIQNGTNVAQSLRDMRAQLGNLQIDVNNRLQALTKNADSLAQQIATLNAEIVRAEGGTGGTANGLRDQRDGVLKQLSELLDIKTVPQENGVINVYVGSEPLVFAADSRGVGYEREVTDGATSVIVTFKSDNGPMRIASGQIGALAQSQTTINNVIDQVDSLTAGLIFELNRLHSSGQGLEGYSSVSAENLVDSVSAALNSADAGLTFVARTGSFVMHVRNKATGLVNSTLVQVDLDGQGGNDTTLLSLCNSIDGIADISASISGGRLTIEADSTDVQISFSQDSSGALAALGINPFFSGRNARDIAVSDLIKTRPSLLAAAKNGERGDNQTALAVAALESTPLTSLGGASLKDAYQAMVNSVATQVTGAKTAAEAAATVRQTLEAQRQALSGVSLDEEAIDLMRQQRAFQSAAKLITVVDELMRTMLELL